MLLPDNGSATVALLTQLVAQSQPNSSTSVTPSAVPVTGTQDSTGFTPSNMAIRINILMFISLFLGLTCALMSTLIQQWAREYLQYSQLSAPPQKRGRVRAHLFQGLTKFQMRRMVESIPVFLHISVFLFFFAFSEFLRTVNDTVGLAARCCFIVLLAAYLILSILPLVVSSAPYQTALTTPLRPCFVFLRFVFRLPMWAVKGIPHISLRTILTSAFQHNRSRDLLADTERKASSLDHLALQWLIEDVDEENMDKFVAGLPALIHSPFITDATVTMGALVEDGMLERIGEHLTSSMSSREVSQVTSISRAFACVEALDAIFSVLDQSTDNPRHIRAASALVRSSDIFRTRQDSTLALRAACVRALTFRKLIDSFPSPAIGDPSHLPLHILPVALRLQTWSLLSSRHWRNRSDIEEAELRVVPSGYDARSIIVREGHLINFLVLIRDVLSYVERPTLDLTSVWEALETMVSAFSITQPIASVSARTRLEEVHTDVRESLYVSNKWGMREGPNMVPFFPFPVPAGIENPDIPSIDGLASNVLTQRLPNTSTKVVVTVQKSLPTYVAERYNQLLELMDRVATGLRLVTFLSMNPTQPALTDLLSHSSGLRLRHDQIFTKDPFGVFDVLDAFSSALPVFIENTSRVNAYDTVERMIAVDGLFRGINQHLDTSVNSDLPEETRERMSMTSFRVLEQVFTLFEKFPTVRWYQFGVDTILDSARNVASSGVVSDLSSIHGSSTLGIMIHVVLGHFRLRMAPGQQPIAENLEEQLFILRIYDWLYLGDDEERERRQDRRQGHSETNREASSPRYLRNLLANGPLQNLSIMAFKLVLDLEDDKTISEVSWTTLHKLMNVPGLEDADDAVALDYFDSVRKRARNAVVERLGSAPLEQLDLFGPLNSVARKLRLPELQLPMPVTPPETPPGDFIPPNRPGYAPMYI